VYQSYDGYGRVTQIHHKDTSSGNSLAKLVYGYDKSHQVTSQDKFFYDGSNNRMTTDTVDEGDQYDYDGAKRLVTVLRGVPTAYIGDTIASNISNTRYDDLIEYNLDQTGNRLTRRLDGSNDRTYAYNDSNEMTTEAGTSQTYTDNGTWSGTSSVTNKYAWNDQFAWWDQGVRQFTWHFDALGRQVARTRSGSGGASDIHLYYDGVHDIEVTSWISSTEAQLRRMVYGERINELLEHTDIDANPDVDYYNHADKLDSVMVLAENDGDIAESYRYKEFGEQTVVDSSFAKLSTYSSNIGNWKRYTGQEHALPSSFGDPWYFYRARVYRADAGRLLQRDTSYSDSANLYAYVGVNPINNIDPTGKNIMPCPGGTCLGGSGSPAQAAPPSAVVRPTFTSPIGLFGLSTLDCNLPNNMDIVIKTGPIGCTDGTSCSCPSGALKVKSLNPAWTSCFLQKCTNKSSLGTCDCLLITVTCKRTTPTSDCWKRVHINVDTCPGPNQTVYHFTGINEVEPVGVGSCLPKKECGASSCL